MFNSERKRKEAEMRASHRLPPGQSLTEKWPVLHYGDVPPFDPTRWDFKVVGLVENPIQLSWTEFMELPKAEMTVDLHCVTRWSRFDTRFEGVTFKVIHDLVKPRPEARFALVHAEQGFTANIPLEDLLRDYVMFALRADGAAARTRARLSPAARCTPPLSLEKREVGSRDRVHGQRSSGFLGAERLSHVRRSVERTAV